MPIQIDNLIQSRRKTISLIIQRDGSLMVRAPLRMSAGHIQEFVQDHEYWIRKKQAQAKASPPPPKKEFKGEENFLLLGIEFPLSIVMHQRSPLTFNGTRFLLSNSKLANARQVFINWYKAKALAQISERAVFHAKRNHLEYGKIRITSARTRWGSCSSTGTLSFTWRLVMAPMEVIDYVIVHELAHTQIKNHSRKFWQRVAEIMPGYKQHVAWLKINGRSLTLGDD
jgi:predicted metal-dependent hydrolase